MPNYEEVIQQSQANIKSLSEKLKDLDKLHQDIKELIKQPEIFETKYQQIAELSENYTNTLGAATKKYLDGNNTMFTSKLDELSHKTKDLQVEISRLVNTDFTKLFLELQKSFIEQTRLDLATELNKFDEKSKELQNSINELNKQVERLESIDLEKHFDKLQKTLSEIFGAVNSINLTLTTITKTLNSVSQSLGTIQNSIDSSQKETKQLIDSFSESTGKHLSQQDDVTKKNKESIENKIKTLTEQNGLLKKELKMNRIILILGIGVSIILSVILLITK